MNKREAYEQLHRAGFAEAQIFWLLRLREKYSAEQAKREAYAILRRLEFVRWLVRTGRLTEQITREAKHTHLSSITNTTAVSQTVHTPTTTGSSLPQVVPTPARTVQASKQYPWITWLEQLWKANSYSDWVPVDISEILRVSQLAQLDALNHLMHLWELSNDFMQKYAQVMTNSILKFWGLGQESQPVIEPDANDKRFSALDWQQREVRGHQQVGE